MGKSSNLIFVVLSFIFILACGSYTTPQGDANSNNGENTAQSVQTPVPNNPSNNNIKGINVNNGSGYQNNGDEYSANNNTITGGSKQNYFPKDAMNQKIPGSSQSEMFQQDNPSDNTEENTGVNGWAQDDNSSSDSEDDE